MPIYNNPALGQAFTNIAQMFAPPSAQDTAAYALARERNEAAARSADIYQYARDPNYDQAVADRLGVLGGLYTPNQSFYAVNQADATTQRGQDVSAASARYGTDRQFEMGRLNNADDNARALATNAATVAGGVEQQRLSTLGGLFGPLNEGQVRPELPAEIAGQFGVGPIGQAEGRAAPLSETEALAQIILAQPQDTQAGYVRDRFAPTATQVEGANTQRLIDQGSVTDQMLIDNIMGDQTPVQIVGPDGSTPQYVSPGAAVRTGAQPYINRGAEAAPQLRNYQTQDGRSGSAVWDNQQKTWLDAGTMRPLTGQFTTFTGELSGGADATGFGPQRANTTKATDLEASLDAADYVVGEMKTILADNSNVGGVPGRVKGILQSLSSSAQQIAGAYAQQAPEAMMTADEVSQLAQSVMPAGSTTYDPNIVRLQSGIFDLAYRRAQISNPGGEVSRQAFERSLESFGQTVLGSQEDLSVALDAFQRDTIAAGRVQVNSLRGIRPNGATPAPTAAGPASTPAAEGVPEGVDPADWELLTPEERRLWQ